MFVTTPSKHCLYSRLCICLEIWLEVFFHPKNSFFIIHMLFQLLFMVFNSSSFPKLLLGQLVEFVEFCGLLQPLEGFKYQVVNIGLGFYFLSLLFLFLYFIFLLVFISIFLILNLNDRLWCICVMIMHITKYDEGMTSVI